MKDTTRCCDYGCDASPGCLGGHDQLVWPELDMDNKGAMPWTHIEEDTDVPGNPWIPVGRTASISIWSIVVLCTLLLAYLGSLVWQ